MFEAQIATIYETGMKEGQERDWRRLMCIFDSLIMYTRVIEYLESPMYGSS